MGDYFYQRYAHRKKLMMTKDEVKREYKEMEGDPEVKSMRRQLFQELAFTNLERDVKKATVILVNPLRFAVAVYYDEIQAVVPVVSGKGGMKRAAKIREYAKKHGIPIVRNAKLARSLFLVDEGTAIPEELYEAVAEVLAFVFEIKRDLV